MEGFVLPVQVEAHPDFHGQILISLFCGALDGLCRITAKPDRLVVMPLLRGDDGESVQGNGMFRSDFHPSGDTWERRPI